MGHRFVLNAGRVPTLQTSKQDHAASVLPEKVAQKSLHLAKLVLIVLPEKNQRTPAQRVLLVLPENTPEEVHQNVTRVQTQVKRQIAQVLGVRPVHLVNTKCRVTRFVLRAHPIVVTFES
jgi:hypothetical protein